MTSGKLPNLNLKRLHQEHCDLFRTFASRRPTCYANGWLYHLRSARNENGSAGFVYHTRDFFVTLGVRKRCVVLVSPMGKKRSSETESLVCGLSESTGMSVLLKKVDSDVFSFLLNRPGFSVCDNPELLEDETFPEHDLEFANLFDRNLHVRPIARQLRRRLRQFHSKEIPLLGLPERGPKSISIVEALTRLVTRDSIKFRAYLQICREVEKARMTDSGPYHWTVFATPSGQVHGLYIAESLTSEVAGLYCAVTSRTCPHATEWMDVSFFRGLLQLGIRRLLLGGSETAGVHHYVQKLKPALSSHAMGAIIYRAPETPMACSKIAT